MAKINCLNPIAACGMDLFNDTYEVVDDFAAADAVLVRSAAMHDLELSDNLLAIARAGAGVNNIPLDKCAERILNEEMYRTDTVFETLADTGITLTVDTNKTDSQNMPQATSFAIEAKLHRYYSDRADLTVFRVIHKSEEAGE